MSDDKCPTCKGPVKITGNYLIGKLTVYTYRSTAAGQLALMSGECAKHIESCRSLLEQLTDKERELENYRGFFEVLDIKKGDKEIGDATERIQAKFDELTAANAVVEQGEKVTKHGLFDVSGVDFIELRHRCEAYRKLQGGDGE